jgi:WD40 repeat protein
MSQRWWIAVLLLGGLFWGAALPAQTGHTDYLEAAAFTPDGRLFCTASDDRSVGVWDGQSGRLVRLLRGHTEAVIGLAMAPEGSRVVSLGRYGELRVWELESGRCLMSTKLPHESFAVAMTPSGRQILVSDGQGGVEFRDPFRGELLWALAPPGAPANEFIWSLHVPPGSRTVAAGCQNGTVRIWDFDSRKWLRDLPGLDDRVWALCATPDGRTLFVGYSLGGGIAWDLPTGQRRFTMPLEDSAVLSFGVTPDGRHVLTGSNPVKMWDVPTGQCVRENVTPDHQGAVWAISPDCRRAVVAHDAPDTHTVELLPLDLGY